MARVMVLARLTNQVNGIVRYHTGSSAYVWFALYTELSEAVGMDKADACEFHERWEVRSGLTTWVLDFIKVGRR